MLDACGWKRLPLPVRMLNSTSLRATGAMSATWSGRFNVTIGHGAKRRVFCVERSKSDRISWTEVGEIVQAVLKTPWSFARLKVSSAKLCRRYSTPGRSKLG